MEEDNSGPLPGPVERRRPDQWSWFESIHEAIYNVDTAIRVERVAGPMEWRYGRQHWPADHTAYYVYDTSTRFARDWWRAAVRGRSLHPAVQVVIEDDWMPDAKDGLSGIVFEFPTHSSDMRLAYIRNEDNGRAERWTVTTPGKYIKARWSYLSDHYIRDVVARTAVAAPQILHTPMDIVRSVQHGPYSCMQWDSDDISSSVLGGVDFDSEEEARQWWVDNWALHPYHTYCPSLGWRAAVRVEDGAINARALVLHASRGPWEKGETLKDAVFVRSYRRTDGYSAADEALEAWLVSLGARKLGAWPEGVELRYVNSGRGAGFLAPYIDGHRQHVQWDGGPTLLISDNGYECTNTNGIAGDGDDSLVECSHCGERTDPETGFCRGYHEDEFVGSCCAGKYVRAFGREGRQYYTLFDNCVCVDGEHYEADYLEDNDIVVLENGEFCHEGDAFECPIRSEWYLLDYAVYTEDEGTVHGDEAWQCAATGTWYSTNIDPVTFDGKTYHPDDAPDDAEESDPFALSYDKPEGSVSNENQIPLPLPPSNQVVPVATELESA